MQSGKISVQTENIFPIIKKFLYSEQEIFLRELISNAIDATSKLKALSNRGEMKGELGNLNIEIIPNKENKTLTIRDRGIGMDEEEVNKYLNQVAFSSAQEFLDKYKDELNIIGHFGLGFYSAFMVAEKVEVITKSYKSDSVAVRWICNGETEYTIQPDEKSDRGTDIVLHLSTDAQEYLEEFKLQTLLDKFCKFLPVPIQLGTKKETIKEGEEDKEIEVPNIINNTNPLWKKSPAEITEEEYKAFYEELYPFSGEPLFWIHLNIDYPFNLTGILYFPKIKNQFEIQKNKIHLYSNQVFVTDDVKEIVPEFLMLLHGVIDSPDIPLNVSRSYLQSDTNVRKITGYITKKVAEKLQELFKKDRLDFERKWDDIGTFIKYGLISDEKFAEKAMAFSLFKNVDKVYETIEEYKEKVKDVQTDKNKRLNVLYTHDPLLHHSIIQQCKNRGYDVLLMDQIIDNHFIQHLEYKAEMSFKRIDSDTVDRLIDLDEKPESVLNEDQQKSVTELFKQLSINLATNTEVKPLSPNDPPIQIVRPEFLRRMSEMQHMMHMARGEQDDMFKDSHSVIVNSNHPTIAQKLVAIEEESSKQQLATYLLELALLEQQMLKGAALTDFVKRSLEKI
ncbi:MAG: molecular chaperone HtpG [Saprospiraceae bacterium]|nr:molecular chaperone HtpG [Candidatus Vicinibacter affinis]